MADWLRSLFVRAEPSDPPAVLRRFGPADSTLSRDTVAVSGDAWAVEGQGDTVARLFEVQDIHAEQCILTYRAAMRSRELQGRAFLEMWVRLPGRGEFFSRGLNQPIRGTTDWATYETRFVLKKGQSADLVKLNLVTEGAGQGQVWIKDIELLKTPR